MKLAACTFAFVVAVAQIFVQATGDFDCSVCSNVTDVQQEVLASYDNGGKRIVCDPTCLDGVTDPTHCNYFGLGQICRGCGECSTCNPCPTTIPTPAPEVVPSQAPSTPPVSVPAASPTDSTPEPTEHDCSVCFNITSAQEEALGSYDNGGKKIVCDPTCLDGVTDPTHCNYFGLGQICRGCGDCSDCSPCPASTPEPTATLVMPSTTTSPPVSTSTPEPVAIATPSTSEPTAFDCSVCSNLTSAQEEVLASYDNGGKKIVCDPTCLDGVTDPIHCNYFGLGQICRGCGDCSDCTSCP